MNYECFNYNVMFLITMLKQIIRKINVIIIINYYVKTHQQTLLSEYEIIKKLS